MAGEEVDVLVAEAVGNRLNLYSKEDIDAYVVEERGEKAGRAQHARKVAKRTKPAA